MSIRLPQNPGIGGLDELTDSEVLFIQNLVSLGDPNADRILFWDDSAGAYQFLDLGTNLSITGTTLNATGGSSGITVATTTITGGTSTRVMYNNAGVVGEYAISGTGSVAMTNSPTFVTPALGTPSSATLTNATGLPISGLVSSTTQALGLGSIELGHASDTTIARVSAGVVSIEGVTIATSSNTLTLSNKSISLGSNTITGTTAQFNTALTDGDFATLAGTETLTNKTLTAAKIANGGFLADANGNELIIFTTTASAVNEITIANAATGNAPSITATGGDTNIDLNIGAKGTGLIKETTARYQDVVTATDGATVTFDLSDGNYQKVTLGGNRTLALSNVKVGQFFVLDLVQDATGSRTVTWFTTIKWAGGAAPTLTTTASKIDTLGFVCTSAGNYQGYVIGQNL